MDILAWCMKYLIFIFNVTSMVCGLLLIVLGSVIIDNINHLRYFETALRTQPVPVFLILIGLVICMVSIFGCCGAVDENRLCLFIYALCMITLFVIQISLICSTFTKDQQYLIAIDRMVEEAWKENDPAPMNALQYYLNCCGVSDYTDYANKPIPNSCCGSLMQPCTPNVYVRRKGCRLALRNFWKNNIEMVRYGGMIVALVELFAFIFACYLRRNIR